jgi:hypothetical protein
MYLEATGDTKWFMDKVGLVYENTIVDVAIIEAFLLQPLLAIDEVKEEETKNLDKYAKESLDKLNKGKEKTASTFLGLINSLVSIEHLSYTFGDCMEMTPNNFVLIWREVDKYFERMNSKLGKKTEKGNEISLETPEDYDM